MPTSRLYKNTHKLGYNTRDNPADIPFEACQSMVNLFPGDPSPRPRFGVSRWNSNALPGAVKRSFPWADETAPKVILHIGDGLYWQAAGGGALTTIDADIVPAGSKLSAVRIKDQLLINNNLTDEDHRAWFLAWDGSAFTIRSANIALPELFSAGVLPVSGVNIPANSFRRYVFTFVNRDDDASMDGSGDPILCRLQDGNYHPGLLESVDDGSMHAQLYSDPVSTRSGEITFDPAGSTIDPQATHLRIHVTESAATATIVDGLTPRWLADIPIKGANAYSEPWVFVDEATDGELAGSLDLLRTAGYEAIPPGTYLLYHNSHLWVGGVGSGEEIGRHFYSELPFDIEFPQKWWSMFRTATHFKDTSYEDAESVKGAAVAGNDIIFFMAVSLWYLQEGDTDFEPRRISKTKGTKFPNSITQRDKEVLYLSNEGPAVVAGREVDALNGHTAGEVWPEDYESSQGYFFGVADKTAVQGFYFQETWWLTDGVKLIGMYMPAMAKAQGPLSIELADAAIGFGSPCVLDQKNLCVLASGLAAGHLWNFLDRTVHNDDGTNFWIKKKTKAMYVSKQDRDKAGEAYVLKVFCHYEDSAVLFIDFISDFFRYQIELAYNEFTADSPLVSPEARVSFRNMMEQPFPEGLVFNSCEIAFRKEHRTPYSYKDSGFILEYLPRDGQAGEFVSRSQGDGLVEFFPDYLFYAKFDEDSDTLTDYSLFGRHHAYAAGSGGSRVLESEMVPGGGQALVGGTGSGYSDADWDGMDRIGDDEGFNSEPLTYEYVASFPTLEAVQVIHEALRPDSTDYWRIQANPDGSLEYQIRTEALTYAFTTPPGTVEAGITDYTIQFVLSNGGQNGQFYAAARSAAFSGALLTTRSAL